MKEGKLIWLNGTFIPSEEATVPIACQAVQYGLAVFEGIRFYDTEKGPAIFRLDDHMKRFKYSFEILRMEPNFSIQELSSAIKETVRKNGIKEGYIRPWIGYTENKLGLSNTDPTKVSCAFIVIEWPPYFSKKIQAKISPYIRPHPCAFPIDAKVCGIYVNSFLAQSDARENGFDEAILLDYCGNVAEATVTNIFVVSPAPTKKDAVIIHVVNSDSMLPGITRDTIIKLCEDLELPCLTHQTIKLAHLYEAKEVFICGTASEIAAVVGLAYSKITRKINSATPNKAAVRKIGNGEPGPITEKLQKLYADVVRGKVPKYKHWLTYV